MTIPLAVFTVVVTWCISLVAVLPLVIERGSHDSPLDYVAAPKRIRWKKLLVVNTLLALLLTAAIALIIKTGIVPVR